MDEDKNNERLFNRYFPAIIQYSILGIIVLDCVAMILLFLVFSKGSITADAFGGGTLALTLTNGVAIIGIAVAVWAGLNISNSVQRNEIADIDKNAKSAKSAAQDADKAKKDADNAKMEAEGLVNDLRKEMSNLARTNKLEFVAELEKSSFNAFHKYMANKVIGLPKDTYSYLEWKEFTIAEREMQFVDAWYNDQVVINRDAIITVINNLEERFKEIRNKEGLAKAYAVVSLSIISYIRGWRLSEKEKFNDCYTFCNDPDVLKTFFDSEKKPLAEIDYASWDANKKEIFAYLCNLAGDSLSACKDHDYEKALELCEKAVEAAPNDDVNKATYVRGVGCVIEREKTKEDKEKAIDKAGFDEVLEYYEEASSIWLKEDNLRSRMSLINKYINTLMGLSNNVKESHFSDGGWDNIQAGIDKNREEIEELNKKLDKLVDVSKNVFPYGQWGIVYEGISLRNKVLMNWGDNTREEREELLCELESEKGMFEYRLPQMKGLAKVTYNDLGQCYEYFNNLLRCTQTQDGRLDDSPGC